eukprot:117863-Rhodomonas_salina.3
MTVCVGSQETRRYSRVSPRLGTKGRVSGLGWVSREIIGAFAATSFSCRKVEPLLQKTRAGGAAKTLFGANEVDDARLGVQRGVGGVSAKHEARLSQEGRRGVRRGAAGTELVSAKEEGGGHGDSTGEHELASE